MRNIARSLAREIDLTSLTGEFDFSMEWSPGQSAIPVENGAAQELGGPAIFSAIPRQLGLKLERRKHPVELPIVDHVEKPSEN